MPPPGIRIALGAALCALAAAAAPAWAQTVQPPTLQVETVVTGLSRPTAMAFIGADDILVAQKDDGRVRRVIAGQLQTGEVLDVDVNAFSERGLLGLATDPDFLHNGYVYLYYTESSGADNSPAVANRVYRYTWDGSALVSPRLILDLPVTSGPNHNGGVILFGPDDHMYAVIGDLNRDGKLQNFPDGPDPDDSGVIFRVDWHGRGPRDNPLRHPTDPTSAVNRYYAYGVRNSFGLGFDPVSGDLWDSENGVFSMDEINRVVPGFNSGWEPIMGPEALSGASQNDLWQTPGSRYSDPEFSWAGAVAPTALGFVATRRLGCGHEHVALVGSANCGALYRFELDTSREALVFTSPELSDRIADNFFDRCLDEQAEIRFGSAFGTITDIENGPDGFVYIVSLSTGRIFRIRPVEPVLGDTDGDLVPDVCDCASEDSGSWAQPTPVPRLRLSETSVVQLGWDDRLAVHGFGSRHTVVSGSLQQLRSTGGYGDACELATGLTVPASSDARSAPAAGDGYYYLVRTGNACSTGSYGDGTSTPDPRDALDAATPPPCL